MKGRIESENIEYFFFWYVPRRLALRDTGISLRNPMNDAMVCTHPRKLHLTQTRNQCVTLK